MAPVATTEKANGNGVSSLKQASNVLFNPFYSPPSTDENDGDYQFAQYKVRDPSLVLVSSSRSFLDFLCTIAFLS